jgi:hypothetical protein
MVCAFLDPCSETGSDTIVDTQNAVVSTPSRRKKKSKVNSPSKGVYGSPIKFQDFQATSPLAHKRNKVSVASRSALSSPVKKDFEEKAVTSMERFCQNEKWKVSIHDAKNRFQGRNTATALACWKRWSKPGEMKVFNTDFNYVRAAHPHPLVLRFKKNPSPELNPAVRSYFDTTGPNITMSIGRKNVNVEMQVCKEEERLGIMPKSFDERKAWLSSNWDNYIARVNGDFHFSKKNFFDQSDKSLARTIGLTNARLERNIPIQAKRPATSSGHDVKREIRWNTRHHVRARHLNGSSVWGWEMGPRRRELDHCKSITNLLDKAHKYGKLPTTPKKSPSKRNKLNKEMRKVYTEMLSSRQI